MSDWTEAELRARIDRTGARTRYPGGSPDPLEVAQYENMLPEGSEIGIVLGMTPELRNLAARNCKTLASIDSSAAAIELYRDWMGPEYVTLEQIHQTDWFSLSTVCGTGAGFILGDGVFGNVLPLAEYGSLLCVIRDALLPTGRFITRQCLVPEDALPRRDALIAEFRSGAIDAAGFGLGLRMHGYLDSAYDPASSSLDNSEVFRRIESDYASGGLSQQEHAIVHRYYFGGRNSLPTQKAWETILQEAGFAFERASLEGKNWYSWYPIYCCTPI